MQPKLHNKLHLLRQVRLHNLLRMQIQLKQQRKPHNKTPNLPVMRHKPPNKMQKHLKMQQTHLQLTPTQRKMRR